MHVLVAFKIDSDQVPRLFFIPVLQPRCVEPKEPMEYRYLARKLSPQTRLEFVSRASFQQRILC